MKSSNKQWLVCEDTDEMIQATCIEKNRDSNNKIVSYKIKSKSGDIKTIPTNDLKNAIKNNKITINNLTLTSDNRLLEHKQIRYPKSSETAYYNRNETISICHCSSKIIEHPIFGEGEKTNDYGLGFYTVFESEEELAKEWACSPFNNTYTGYVNRYKFNTNNIKTLNFDKMNIIYWITLTATYRKPNIDQESLRLLQSRYLIDTKMFDCICGWRCDDTFSKIITEFINNHCTDKAIEEAIRLGHLKQQFVLISRKSFNNIHSHRYETVKDFKKYRERFVNRKAEADNALNECIKRNRNNGKYLDDYLEAIRNEL